jgi:hypothetical protein
MLIVNCEVDFCKSTMCAKRKNEENNLHIYLNIKENIYF